MNFKSKTLWTGDNLPILRGLNSGTVDLIYLDPPFNSNRDYEAPIGSKAAGAAFKDTWTLSDVDNAWVGEIADREPGLYHAINAAEAAHSKSMKSYLIMMAIRLLEMKRLLKSTGSIYLHCDPTASHYLKLLMDSVFGKQCFRNEIIWHYAKWSNTAKHFQRNHDILLFYSNGSNAFNVQLSLSANAMRIREKGYHTNRVGGVTQLLVYDKKKARHKIEEGAYDKVVYVQSKGTPLSDTWTDINLLNSQAKERVGYPTQKPLALLERIIKSSSNKGDMVLDPFCGCATALVAAEQAGRKWVGVDISQKAVDLIRTRMKDDLGILQEFKFIHRSDLPQRTDIKRSRHAPAQQKHILFGQQEGLCNGCKHPFPFRNFTIDHIIPKDHGGGENIENKQLLCGACNSTKATGSQEDLIARLKKQGVLK